MQAESKEVRVREMFAQIAPTYDLLNSLLSCRIHTLWRPVAIRSAVVEPGHKVLDLASGTGDLALLAAKDAGPTGQVVGVDYCAPMLTAGRDKVKRRRVGNVAMVLGTADDLPFEDGTFDSAMMAFGLRNVPDPRHCLAEMARVVRPGGWVVNLDLTRPVQPLAQRLYRWYQDHVMPTIGGWISGKREAYAYLPQSIQAFPPPAETAEMLTAAGLEDVTWQSLTMGLATVHRGRKP